MTDNTKPPMGDVLIAFGNALREVARVHQFGESKKHAPGSWKKESAEVHTNSLVRHLAAESDSMVDMESNLLHAAHAAWRALARLEKILEITRKKSPCVKAGSIYVSMDGDC